MMRRRTPRQSSSHGHSVVRAGGLESAVIEHLNPVLPAFSYFDNYSVMKGGIAIAFVSLLGGNQLNVAVLMDGWQGHAVCNTSAGEWPPRQERPHPRQRRYRQQRCRHRDLFEPRFS